MKRRFKYVVEVDQDMVPGFNHQAEDMQKYLKKHLNETIEHYNPTVTIIPEEG